jgi:CheY-like chemotaxis protein
MGIHTQGVAMPVLAVDDNESHCYALSRWLQKSGYRVLNAGSVKETLDVINREKPRLVLLDVHLPDGNGYDLCRTLKGNPETKNIKVIVHTATDCSWFGRMEARAAGASAFLTHPVYPDELIAVVQGVLAGSS